MWARLLCVEAVLPLHDHAQMLVVEDDHLDRQLLAMERGQLLNVHEEAAVAVDVDDQCVGKGRRAPIAAGRP